MKYIIEKYLNPIADKNPPDFCELEKALESGLDINLHDERYTHAYDQDTMLSYCLDCYGYNDSYGKVPYIAEIVSYFLKHGYDVHANDEYNGILALGRLAFTTCFDKYTLEAAKLLLNAGTDTEKNMYEGEGNSSIRELVINHDGDNRGLTEDDFYAANYFYTFNRAIKCRNKGKDIKDIYHPDVAIGKEVNGIYIKNGFKTRRNYRGGEVPRVFEDLYIDCEGSFLNITQRIRIAIDPYLNDEDISDFIDVSKEYEEFIGNKICSIDYKYIGHNNITNCEIEFENGNHLYIKEDYERKNHPRGYFMYLLKN